MGLGLGIRRDPCFFPRRHCSLGPGCCTNARPCSLQCPAAVAPAADGARPAAGAQRRSGAAPSIRGFTPWIYFFFPRRSRLRGGHLPWPWPPLAALLACFSVFLRFACLVSGRAMQSCRGAPVAARGLFAEAALVLGGAGRAASHCATRL